MLVIALHKAVRASREGSAEAAALTTPWLVTNVGWLASQFKLVRTARKRRCYNMRN